MSSGLIYAVIVGVWAAVLLPLWARRHQEAAAERTADQFSRAMRVLARPPGSPEGELTARRSVSDDDELRRLAPFVGKRRRARAMARARRARALLGLLAVTALTAVLTLLGAVPWLLLSVPVVVLAAFVAVLRVLARAEAVAIEREEAALEWVRLARTAQEASAHRHAGPRDDPAAGEASLVIDLREGETGEAAPGIVAGTAVDAASDDFWDPREFSLPTYARKNALHRRRITFGDSSPSWTGAPTDPQPPARSPWARPEAEPRATPAPRPSEGPTMHPGGGPGDDVEHRRAVND